MSDEDDETVTDDTPDSNGSISVTPESVMSRLDDVESTLEAAETESALDEIETTLTAVTDDLEASTLPKPDNDEEDPTDELESRIEDLESALDTQRGPYASDILEQLEEVMKTIEETRWTATGLSTVTDAVDETREDIAETISGSISVETPSENTDTSVDEDEHSSDGEVELIAQLNGCASAIADEGLDADEDAATIEALIETAETISENLENAEEWDDLDVNEKLMAEGYYDVLGHYKDFPPEWSALKEWESRGRVDMILLAKDNLQSEFMQNHCMDALTRMADPAAFDEMHELAQRREEAAVKALGRMGSGATDAVETLREYIDEDSDPGLQKVTFQALGEIGSPEATQPLANKLMMENENVRPYAARALGLIGDTRAIQPLGKALHTDESDDVRAAAAWALRQIGTQRALQTAAEHIDERSYLIQHEAKRAADALDTASG
ncbi:HEAT repeat domain-containing protein [Haloquadratum walsbyi]|uniref:PBS lyase HEAT-like repeat protein n=1 Tax=Haloquadratum walsbyi J07HQW2 TaxID=1238425 RepID=U1NI72_9EURY|nr:HEAT repeat domain-containing protein [Haloquadratum walsbyi]ERG96603.1 MAG: PBS lyase HEAT-like repeat protein [Haloquadratum walsbyi J07HQW2]